MVNATTKRLLLRLCRRQTSESNNLGRLEAVFLLEVANLARCSETVHDGHANVHEDKVE